MVYYVNALYFFSFLGFCLESMVYKFHNSKRHSGIFYGPVTFVYGFGILMLILLKKYVLDKLNLSKPWKVIVTFILCWITLTGVEWLGGNILYEVFQVNLWDYSKKTFHCGKYICLELSLVWGVLGTVYLYLVKDFFDKFIALIPKKLTKAMVIINLIDMILILINKLP